MIVGGLDMSAMLLGYIRNGRVEVSEPMDWPDGTEVVVATKLTRLDDDPVPPEEIVRVLAAMHKLQPLDIPDSIAADLDDWERKINKYGINQDEEGIEDTGR